MEQNEFHTEGEAEIANMADENRQMIPAQDQNAKSMLEEFQEAFLVQYVRNRPVEAVSDIIIDIFHRLDTNCDEGVARVALQTADLVLRRSAPDASLESTDEVDPRVGELSEKFGDRLAQLRVRAYEKLAVAIEMAIDERTEYPEDVIDLGFSVAVGLNRINGHEPSPAPDEVQSGGPVQYQRDQIYGPTGIMHHIRRTETRSGGASYFIEKGHVSRDFKVFGHNGLQNGQCFPLRINALRDGAHGQSVAGISASVNDGAYSVVVSGKNHDLDPDEGNVVYYASSESHKNAGDTPDASSGMDSLQRSFVTRNPIRLLRTHNGKWWGKPKVGVRYDGLYRCVNFRLRRNAIGGIYKQFRLVRNDFQGNIMVNEPETELRRMFAQVQKKDE